MPRVHCTRAELIERVIGQAEIVANLVQIGALDTAAKVTRCWLERIFADTAQHRSCCRSPACLSCKRPPLDAWYRSYSQWVHAGGPASYAELTDPNTISDLPIIAKKLRKFRDHRRTIARTVAVNVLEDPPLAPLFDLSPGTLAYLGYLRRGLEPARFMVMPRRTA